MTFSPLIIGTMRLGSWGAEFSTEALENFIDACIDLGLRDFDHADIYGDYTTEEEFGRVLGRRPDLRSKMQITTKCGILMPCSNRPHYSIKSYDSSSLHIRRSVEKSLENLSVECIDLLLIHRPDLLMHPGEMAEELEKLKQEGKIIDAGLSNFSRSQCELVISEFDYTNHQLEISLTHLEHFENGNIDFAFQKGIKLSAWSPLGGGLIFKDDNKLALRIRKCLDELADKYDAGYDQLLLAWILRHPAGIIPVLGTSKIDRIVSALKATKIELEREDWYAMLEAARGYELA